MAKWVAAVDNVAFHHDSARARQARFARVFSSSLRIGLGAGAAAFFLLGVALLWYGSSLGWLMVGIAVLPVCLHEWYHDQLRPLPPGKGSSIDELLAGDVLARLPAAPTPKDLALAAMQTTSGQFFVARYGIGPSFLAETSSAETLQTADVWQEVMALAGRTAGQPNGATIVAALLKTQPPAQALLTHLQLDVADIDAGAQWYARLDELIARQAEARRTGGIARDWTFGYTPTLSRFGTNLSTQLMRGGMLHAHLESHRAALDYMVETFGRGGRQNVALVGPLGAGKTTLLYAFADLLLRADAHLPERLRFRQIVSLSAGTIVSHAHSRGELEQLMNHLMGEAFAAQNIILCLDDAQLFFEEGVGSVDLSSLLMPIFEAGRLRLILAMDEQSWLRISARNPALAGALNRCSVPPASYDETIRVMQDQLINIEFQRKVVYMFQALKEAYRLSERYQYDMVMPGKAVRLLESAAAYAADGVVTAASVQQAVERTSGVKVALPSGDSAERERLLHMEELIHQRMINQTAAVKVVSDALRRARAGVRNEQRPIGTFLFLGPTGVGKTELAKSIAAVYFGGEDRLIRLDLNEFGQAQDATRLIASGADEPHSLVAGVMKQPFSVVLLDEIEKAHPQVLAALLQVLDEGILRDGSGREISFRDTIIVATSNAGADDIRARIDAGQDLEQLAPQIQEALISSHQFRPEFLNRFDEIVVFRPLTPTELLQVVDLIIAGLNTTLAHQKISVTIDDVAKKRLVEMGYDPRLGARPMRRVVQRTVENLTARRMLEGRLSAGDTLAIGVVELEESQQ